jgi:flagellar protein FlbD
MIPVTLFDGNPCWINPDHILMLESRPDTLLRLSNGEKWLVKESIEELQARFLAFKQAVYALHPKPQSPEDPA